MRQYEVPLSVGDMQRSVAICIIAASTVCVALLNCTFGVLRYACTTNPVWQVLLGKLCGLFACESLRDRMRMARRALRPRYQLSSDFPY